MGGGLSVTLCGCVSNQHQRFWGQIGSRCWLPDGDLRNYELHYNAKTIQVITIHSKKVLALHALKLHNQSRIPLNATFEKRNCVVFIYFYTFNNLIMGNSDTKHSKREQGPQEQKNKLEEGDKKDIL